MMKKKRKIWGEEALGALIVFSVTPWNKTGFEGYWPLILA